MGEEPRFHARTEARSWPLRSPGGCAKIRPTPSGGSGPGCANGSLRDAASGDRLRLVPMSSTSHALPRGWSLRLMGASTAGRPRKMLREGLGSRPMGSTSCASGTTRSTAIWRGCWMRSGGPYRIERRVDPPPRPSAARGEGVCFMLPRSNSGGDCLTSAPSGDKVDCAGPGPRQHWLAAEQRWLHRNGVLCRLAGAGQGAGYPAIARASAGA